MHRLMTGNLSPGLQNRLTADLAEGTRESDTAAAVPSDPHPLCTQVRALRKASGLSLAAFQDRSGIPAVVVGAYERGDRIPPLSKLDQIFGFFGYRLAAIPCDTEYVRLGSDMVAELRAIADQLEQAQAAGETSSPDLGSPDLGSPDLGGGVDVFN